MNEYDVPLLAKRITMLELIVAAVIKEVSGKDEVKLINGMIESIEIPELVPYLERMKETIKKL